MTIQLIPESGIIRYVDNEGDVVRRLVGDLPVWVQRFIDDFVRRRQRGWRLRLRHGINSRLRWG